MLLIKKGKIPAEQRWRGRCGTCKAKYEMTRGEVKANGAIHIGVSMRGDTYCAIRCPYCNADPNGPDGASKALCMHPVL